MDGESRGFCSPVRERPRACAHPALLAMWTRPQGRTGAFPGADELLCSPKEIGFRRVDEGERGPGRPLVTV